MAFLGNIVTLRVQAHRLQCWRDDQNAWCLFQDEFLNYVCAARNSPFSPDDTGRQDWWLLKIQLSNAIDFFDYVHEFSASTDADLKNLLSPDSTFSQAYHLVRQGSNLVLHVSSSEGGLATKDYKTKLSTNRGLLSVSSPGMEVICYHLYRKAEMKHCIMPRPPELQQPLSNRHRLYLSEDACLQFKGLEIGKTTCTNKMKAQGRRERFQPQRAQHYVEWIWERYHQGLGDYISAFTKNEEGGAIYYGLNETRFGYIMVGLPLCHKWRETIMTGICENVCKRMLWVERDPASSNGYRISTPEEIKKHFAVDFIQIDPHLDLYILEVRVSSFNGVVFNDPQGPEAYRMETTPRGQFKPVRLRKEEWLEKMRDYGWCSRHRRPKERQCQRCVLEHN